MNGISAHIKRIEGAIIDPSIPQLYEDTTLKRQHLNWRSGSSSRVPTLQAGSTDLESQSH
jgi:hypothetical protein